MTLRALPAVFALVKRVEDFLVVVGECDLLIWHLLNVSRVLFTPLLSTIVESDLQGRKLCLQLIPFAGNRVVARSNTSISFKYYFSLSMFCVDADAVDKLLMGSSTRPLYLLYMGRGNRRSPLMTNMGWRLTVSVLRC